MECRSLMEIENNTLRMHWAELRDMERSVVEKQAELKRYVEGLKIPEGQRLNRRPDGNFEIKAIPAEKGKKKG